MSKLILDLCGGIGSWSKPYADAGYQVIIIDAEQDVRLHKVIDGLKVHGILAAPPCTHLANSGARWWKEKGDKAIIESLSIVDACLRLIQLYNPDWWALENPVGRLSHYIGPAKMYFDPCDYGDPYTKRTGLWGEFDEPLQNRVVPSRKSPIHWMSPSPDRAKKRSITPPGFARAFFEANP